MNKRIFPSKEFLIILSIFIDAFLVFAAELTAFFFRFGLETGPFPRVNFSAFLQIAIPLIVLRLICFYVYGLYDKPKYKSTYDIVLNVIKANTVSTLIIIVLAFLLRAFAYPRTVILLSYAVTIPYIIIWRLWTKRLINWVLGKNYFISHVLIIGTDRDARRLATRLIREAHINRHLTGFIKVDESAGDRRHDTFILGTVKDLPRIIAHYLIDEAVIATPRISKENILDILGYFSGTDVVLRIVPSLYEATIGSMASSPTERVPLISPTVSRKLNWYKDLKRLLDTAGAFFGLICFSPLMFLISLFIKLSSRGPVLYKQKRAGLHGKIFTLYKFRTMTVRSEVNGPEFAREDDERITPVGKFLRRFRLDELPQLYNVLINDMSLIGPRPERPYFVKELIREIPFYAERLEVKPGISGWAQVTYGYASSRQEHQEKLLYDIFYLENMSLALDGLILIKTLGVVIRGKGVK